MIYDKISNLDLYAGLSEGLKLGLEYLRSVDPNIEKGVYHLSPAVRAIVSEYDTKPENEYGYEAHRDYIDIQYLLSGTERICSLPLEYLRQTKAYNGDIDAAFYTEADMKPQESIIGNGYFAIYFPQDGHMPGLCAGGSGAVKKVVVKVKC
ncbi:MAG: YhcH/YjgK/YiaL family protein [Bacteroidales bacterium]|nr:YhcH/YjgK/YiaL family protein [Bacteroidales bacterium]